MELPWEVPLCPPGLGSAIARHLLVNGWKWDDELLITVVTHLADEDVRDTRAFVGLDFDDIPVAANWPPEVRAFMVTIVKQAACAQIVHCAPVMPSASITKRPRINEALALVEMPTLILNVQKARPLEALELLSKNLPRDDASLAIWRHGARVAAVMGSCPRSLESFKSGTFPVYSAILLHMAVQCV
jgi:hypothetical protein